MAVQFSLQWPIELLFMRYCALCELLPRASNSCADNLQTELTASGSRLGLLGSSESRCPCVCVGHSGFEESDSESTLAASGWQAGSEPQALSACHWQSLAVPVAATEWPE